MSTEHRTRGSDTRVSGGTHKAPSEGRPEHVEDIHDEVARRILRYTPADVPAELWHSTLRPFVLPALRAAHPQGISSMEQFARVLTLIARWCVEQGIPLDIEVVLDPDTVERFFTQGLRHIPSRGTYRTVLRRLGRELTRTAPWQPPPEPMARRKVALPYTPAEMRALREDAANQSTAPKRRAALALIVLGGGLGLDGRWARAVKGTDIERVPGGVLVRVRAPRARTVPVLKEYEQDLLLLADEAGEEFLIGGTVTHRNRTNKVVRRFESGHGRPRLSVPRLRSTWVVTHLTLGTRLPELLEAAGTSRIETFDELLAFVPALDEEAARRMLWGRG
jgi:hypothetical protein